MGSRQLRAALLSLHTSPLAAPGTGDAGGMNVYVRELARGLATQGVDVDVFTRWTDGRTPEVVVADGVRFISLRSGPPRRMPKSILPFYIPDLVSALQEFEAAHHAYDLVHSHYWLSGAVALEADLGAPIVHMFHTLSRVKELYSGQADPADTLLRLEGERSVIARAQAIVGATDDERVQIENLYGPIHGLYRVIPPGVDLEMFRPRGREWSRRRLHIDAEHVLLFVGRPDPIKGLDLLLDQLPDIAARVRGKVKLVVVGGSRPGSSEIRRLRGAIEQGPLSGLVEYRGLVPQRDLPLYYSAADLCTVPSAYESFGMAALEAMACSTPVVAFNVGGLATTVRDDVTGFLVSPGDGRAYADAVVAGLEGDIDAMGRRARIAAQRFRWDNIARRTVDLYSEVAETVTAAHG